MSFIKERAVRAVAVDRAPLIACELGLRRIRSLTADEIWDLTEAADTAAIANEDIYSFRHAHLIMEAVDAAGETCYVAVEISSTAGPRVTKRALRNADFLTRFTGRTAYAAVSGLERDGRIREVIESGAVFWLRIDPDTFR